MRRCEFDAEQATELDQVVCAGYVAGLREAGWQDPVERVRLGYTAAVGLRWTLLARTLRVLAEGAPPLRTVHGWRVPPDAVARLWIHFEHVLARSRRRSTPPHRRQLPRTDALTCLRPKSLNTYHAIRSKLHTTNVPGAALLLLRLRMRQRHSATQAARCGRAAQGSRCVRRVLA